MQETVQQLVQDRMRELRENTDFVDALLESLIGYAIIAADFDGNIIAYNEGARQVYGYAPEEVIDKQSIEIFFPKDFIEAGKLQEIIADLIEKGRFSYEGEKVRKSGERFPAQILFTLTKDKGGKVVGFIEIVADLTERKRAEELSVRQERLAIMGALASIIGHEVRRPLSVIRNSVEFLRLRLGTSLDEKVRRHLDILQEEVKASDKIIDDTLNFARLKELALTTADANSIVESAIESATVPANIKIERKFGTNLPQVTVDISQIQQVFFNIITNAIDAMSEGGTLTIVTKERSVGEKGHGFVEISFRDTGVGIPKENLSKIFAPLFTTKSKGVGLGLATCRNILNAHNGVIDVESEVGKGTTVTVKLPIKQQLRKEV